MKGLRWPLVLSGMLLGCAAASSAPPTDAERAAIADTIASLADGLFEAARAVDADGVLGLIDDRPGFPFANEGQLLMSRDDFAAAVRGSYANLRGQTVELTAHETVVLDRDHALTFTVGPWAEVGMDGVATPSRSLAVTLIWQRGPNGWRWVAGHQSVADLPGPASTR